MSGSGGGGGYEYQAMATAYVAAHILSQVRLGWIEHERADVPISVAEETGGAGDDLCITLISGIKIELQAKHGLQKDKLWEPLIKFGKGLIADPQMYGVILTDSTASKNIREDLRNDFKRLGQERTDDLKAITKEAQTKLVEAGLPESDQEFFRRLVIIVLDLDTGLQHGKQAQLLLSHVLIDKKQSGIVWDCLCKEGENLISHRGKRDLNAWKRLIGNRGIQIATDKAARNLEETCKELENLCKEVFTNYRQLTTNRNSLMAAIGLAADLSSVIPLEIVERKQTSKSRDDIQSPEQGSRFYQPTEKEEGERFTTTDEFLEKVIRDRNTSRSKGLRLAITGEAGAGKTTLLQTIGSYIDTNGLIPIWIPLQSLNKNVDTYLAEDYLRQITATLPTIDISIEYGEALNELLKSGRVVLLLDGADEATDRNILQNLDRDLQQNQLFKNTQVILSCRINAWDEGWRGNFDVYRIVPFTYPDQVENYIDQFSWGEGKGLANSLKTTLRDEKKLRLRDMVANPLRLALLCYIWKDGEERLPDTRAELYRLMLKAFYKQKQDELINREFGKPSKELEEALGKLAINALDQSDYKYLIPESDIQKILGDLDDENRLFWQATKKLGLLNHVGKSSKKQNENVYAFWHPTFQEYFAALAISDWNLLLPKNHLDKPIEEESYKIFDTSWEEVILIWSGRDEIDERIDFIDKLIHFEDGCINLYGFRAYCLSAKITKEFWNHKFADSIINQIVDWAFNSENMLEVHIGLAREALAKSDPIRVEYALTQLLKSNQEQLVFNDTIAWKCFHVCEYLLKISPHNLEVRNLYSAILNSNINEIIRIAIIISITSKEVDNIDAISGLFKILQTTENPNIQLLVEQIIKELYPIEEDKIYSIYQNQESSILPPIIIECYLPHPKKPNKYLLRSLELPYANQIILEFIDLFNIDNEKAISTILLEISKCKEKQDFQILDLVLRWISFWDRRGLEQLNRILDSSSDEYTKLYLASTIMDIDQTNYSSVKTLLNLLINSQDIEIHEICCKHLQEITNNDLLSGFVISLKENIKIQQKNFSLYKSSYSILWHCARNMSYPDFYKAWHA